MINSVLKKGLAATAVSALAMTGIAMSAPAFADGINNPATGVNLRSLVGGGTASTADDGTNTTISLVATGSSDVAQVQLSYDAGSGPVAITTVTRGTNSAFAYEWAPPAAINNLPVTIIAQGQTVNGTAVGAPDSKAVTLSSTQKAVDLTPAGPTIGLYKAGDGNYYGAVSGTVSTTETGTVDLSSVAPGAAQTLGTATAAGGKFAGVGNFGAYHFSTATPAVDEVVVKAQLPDANNTADAVAYAVYEQTVAGITATPTPASVPTGGNSDVVATVVDQKGNPVAGAKVYKNTAAPVLVGTTDVKGQVHDSEPTGNYTYFVDGDNARDGVFTSGVDFSATASIGTYAPVATTATLVNGGKAAFDRDSYNAGDLKVKIVDQNGIALAGKNFFYSWSYTPFKPSPTDVAATVDEGFVTSGPDGTATLTFPNPANGAAGGTYVLNGYISVNPNPGKDADDPAIAAQTIKAGEAEVVWNDVSPAQRQAGTKQTFKGVLELQDGTTTLAGQKLGVTWAQGTSSAVVAAQADQPAGTTRNGDTSASTTTAADGSFSVALSSPAAVPPAVQGNDGAGTLTATGNAVPDGPGADATAALAVQFLANTGVDAVTAGTPAATPGFGGNITPGRPAQLNGITVKNADGDPLANQQVTVSVDHGFIATTDAASTNPGDLVADPAPAAGAEYGDWKSAGTSKTFTTDGTGQVNGVELGIGKDAGFDDDGQVTANVTITAGGKSTTKQVTFSSSNPLNVKDLAVTLAATQDKQLTALPKAALDEGNKVDLQVRAHDQFGNLTAIPVSTTETGAGGLTNVSATSGFGTSVQATASDDGTAGVQDVAVATGPRQSNVWKNTGTALNPVWVLDNSNSGAVTGTGTSVTWYAVDYAASTFTLTHNTASTVAPGTSVIETYTAKDQFGAPIFGKGVNFLRSGPDANQTGNLSGVGQIDNTGRATYLFQGTKAGVANLTAVLGDLIGGNVTNPIAASQANDKVTFATPPVVKIGIVAKLTAKNYANGDDRLAVSTNRKAAGATVTYYKVVKGKLRKIGTSRINSLGQTAKRVSDHTKAAKKAKTTYVIKISATAKTKAATSKRITIK